MVGGTKTWFQTDEAIWDPHFVIAITLVENAFIYDSAIII